MCYINYVPHTNLERSEMLAAIGLARIEVSSRVCRAALNSKIARNQARS